MIDYKVTREFIQSEHDKGYSLADIENALELQKEGKLSYQESMDQVHPPFVNLSKKAKSKIKSDLPEGELKVNPEGMVSATAVDSNTLNKCQNQTGPSPLYG